MKAVFVALALGSAPLLAGPAWGQVERNGKVAAPAEMVIPFAPPLSQDLIYDVAVIRVGGGKETRRAETRQSLRFERAEGGYTLKLSYLRMTDGKVSIDLSDPASLALIPADQQALLRPMAFDLDADGALLRVHDWDGMRRSIAAFVAQMPGPDAAARHVMEEAVRPLLALDAEQAASVVLKGWPSFLGYGGFPYEDGAEYEASVERPAGLLPIALPFTLRFSVTRSEPDGALHFEQHSQPDERLAAAAIAQYLRSIGGALAPERRAELDKQLEAFGTMKIRDLLDIRFDAVTGLVRDGKSERRVTLDMPEAVEVLDIVTASRVR